MLDALKDLKEKAEELAEAHSDKIDTVVDKAQDHVEGLGEKKD